MAFIGGPSYEVQVVGLQGSELCYTNFDYGMDEADPVLTWYQVAAAFQAQVIPFWQDLCTLDFQFLEVRCRGSFSAGSGFIPLSGVFGTVSGQTEPPFVTANFSKRPVTPDSQEGDGPRPIRHGRFGLSGVPESIGSNGSVYDGTWLTNAGLWSNAVLALSDIDGVGHDAFLVIERDPVTPDGPPDKLAQIIAVQFVGYGTQNTRKR